ncbi:hypothetical protein [Sporomusa acidovorans]|uniref:Uncharacterized protein n=1 Tax=Sporomusa acidovorans (strain ATCC 49682 / DSM 3132 / Mol) TaxID=1123286 RepID=A0ABZ3JAP5_SPOA4|nr:hypothetical protein [Sporomusa acidovorans]OZC13325.1 hypothetical protein SPACI_58210 [Sporomusa acidovorans DSM 3132]SDD96581.1 hypothetical protein SAMN04488499_100627 [Sporomusa acidovorans]
MVNKNTGHPNVENSDKVFDTDGMEASLTQSNLTQSFDNAQENSAQNNKSSSDASLDHKADAIINLNGTPESASTGTARTALMQSDQQGHTFQVDKDSRITTYR